jgi:hypothetical protein
MTRPPSEAARKPGDVSSRMREVRNYAVLGFSIIS